MYINFVLEVECINSRKTIWWSGWPKALNVFLHYLLELHRSKGCSTLVLDFRTPRAPKCVWVFTFLLKMCLPWALWVRNHYHVNDGKHLMRNKTLHQPHSVVFQRSDPYAVNFADVKGSCPNVQRLVGAKRKTDIPHLEMWPRRWLRMWSCSPSKNRTPTVIKAASRGTKAGP